jgi:glucokinase
VKDNNGKTLLAGDIGGTKTRLGLFVAGIDGLRSVAERTYPSAEFSGLEAIVAGFLREQSASCRAASFGIAGPVVGRRARTTNLPWVVDADSLEEGTGIARVSLLNDLEATAWGLPLVEESGLHTLNRGTDGASGNWAVIAAGTGLGEAGLHWDGQRYRPFACEGGHASYSPTDELTDDLLRYLRQRFESVSWERVLSGPGLADLYRFLLDRTGQPEPDWFRQADNEGDPAPAITAAGLAGRCEVSTRVLGLFARLYGEEAGNLALKLMATGGVWVCGGIAPKILSALVGGEFMAGFTAKGRMSPLLEAMPVKVVLDDRVALLGAANHAAGVM